jgi:hypothetical protein
MVSGCSTVNRTFTGVKTLDVKPFAEYTISLAADIEYGLNQQRAYYLHDFRDDRFLQNHDDLWKGVRMILKGIVACSVEVTTLGSSTLSGPERCDKLAEFLDEMTRPVLIKYPAVFNATTEDLDSLLMHIREQKDLITGLGATQPWVVELARVADMVFDGVNDNLAKRQLRKSQITVIVWSRVHRDLARGIVELAKVNIFDLTKNAIDTAL